jgi:hypothetical protein
VRRTGWLAICLAILQAWALASAVEARARAGHALDAAFTATIHCNDQQNRESPARGRHSHAQCCVSCCPQVFDDDWRLAATWSEATILPQRAATARLVGRLRPECDARVEGWASSWSSRAPPRLS